ncbi:DUF2911 domain-containing protein [Aquimarina intermedia]|uniref:DUF2911 family protein n=1 Tax=Aquimarina intermedia TaxID=350814 RepID=A0A5S5CGY8_9FLAO|nr:DUF2911 domain-containing protein [Aquimarina intermedia]TYP77283.1 Protein of unknown function (DUF2911) [Aquimarina intermedia]
MKKLISVGVVLMLLYSCNENKKESPVHSNHEVKNVEVQAGKKTLSPHESVMQMIGDAHIHIDYSSPGVRNRIIFGGLLPYDTVWQAGAHNATWIETNKDLIINQKELPSGRYGFFVIPSKDSWTLIFNKNWEQHGKDEYSEQDDVLRFDVAPVTLNEVHEHLEYVIEKKDSDEGLIRLRWEKIEVKFPFKVKK